MPSPIVAATRSRRIMSEIPAEEQVVLVQALGRLASAGGEVPEQDWTTGWDL